jgi:putative membrane protein
MKNKLKIFLKGFAMGSVDIVPGISGGTMALILGIYQKIINELKNIDKEFIKFLLSFKFKKAFKKVDITFLLFLFLGIIVAIISLSKIISHLLENNSFYLYSFFFGLIIASIFIILPKKFFKDPKYLFIIPGIIIAWLISGGGVISSPNTYFNIFISGAIAICAMILPGISGSFVLLILDKYEFMINILRSPFSDNNFIFLSIFVLGCIVGLLSFVRLLSYFLKKYYKQSIAILIGFMAGALRKIWPFGKIESSDNVTYSFIFLVLGISIVLISYHLSKKKKEL